MAGRIEEIDQVLRASISHGSIFIGNFLAASNLETLRKHNIRAVITAARGLMLPHNKEEVPDYLYLPVDDDETECISRFFETVFQFIDKNSHRTNILVHCLSGISRSAALIIGYLLKKKNYTLNQAVVLLRSKKRRIKPNKNFMKQLEDYQSKLKEKKVQSRPEQNQTNNSKSLDEAKKGELNKQLQNIKCENTKIQRKIYECKQKIILNEERKRSKSEYLKRRLAQKSEHKKNDESRISTLLNLIKYENL